MSHHPSPVPYGPPQILPQSQTVGNYPPGYPYPMAQIPNTPMRMPYQIPSYPMPPYTIPQYGTPPPYY